MASAYARCMRFSTTGTTCCISRGRLSSPRRRRHQHTRRSVCVSTMKTPWRERAMMEPIVLSAARIAVAGAIFSWTCGEGMARKGGGQQRQCGARSSTLTGTGGRAGRCEEGEREC